MSTGYSESFSMCELTSSIKPDISRGNTYEEITDQHTCRTFVRTFKNFYQPLTNDFFDVERINWFINNET